MDSSDLYIITRLGIGTQRSAFFEEHLELLEMTAAASLANQNDQDFTWVVITDRRAPEWVDERLSGLRRGTAVWRVDPLEESLNPARTISKRLAAGAKKRAIRKRKYIARLDDDDLVHAEFVKKVKTTLDKRRSPCGMTFPLGVFMTPQEQWRTRFPWNAVGLTTFDPKLKFNSYSVQHNRFKERLPDVDHLEVDSKEPMWIRTFRRSSSTGLRVREQGEAYSVDFGAFGLSQSDVQRLRSLCDVPVTRSPLIGQQAPAILDMKSEILRQYKKAKADCDTKRAELFAQIFYRI